MPFDGQYFVLNVDENWQTLVKKPIMTSYILNRTCRLTITAHMLEYV